MGADGGIVITQVSDIKENWSTIRKKIIEDVKNNTYVDSKYVKKLPKTLMFTEDIGALLMPIYRNCDTPYQMGDVLITAYGDNIWENQESISYILAQNANGFFLETWT